LASIGPIHSSCKSSSAIWGWGVSRTRYRDFVSVTAHSEAVGLKTLQDEGIDLGGVKRVYSERQPCAYNFANCARSLDDLVPQAKVTWSFDYGASKAINSAANQALRVTYANLGMWNTAVNGVAK
jgi:Xanthomonas XOO_2897-like deaminase